MRLFNEHFFYHPILKGKISVIQCALRKEHVMLKTRPERARSSAETRYLPIEGYGIIGDLYTVALVGINGSIDWCCLPHFDSPSVFAAILDDQKGGSFRIASLYE